MPFAVPQQYQAQPNPGQQRQQGAPSRDHQDSYGQVQQPQRQADPWGSPQRGYGRQQPMRRPQPQPQPQRGYGASQRGYGQQQYQPPRQQMMRPAVQPQQQYQAQSTKAYAPAAAMSRAPQPELQQQNNYLAASRDGGGYADGAARRGQEVDSYAQHEQRARAQPQPAPRSQYGAPPPVMPSYGYGGWDKGPVSDYREAQPQYAEVDAYNKGY